MNKKQKAILVLWMGLTLLFGIFTVRNLRDTKRNFYASEGYIIDRHYELAEGFSAWATATLVMGALLPLCASKKPN
jgi:hypothetical protein